MLRGRTIIVNMDEEHKFREWEVEEKKIVVGSYNRFPKMVWLFGYIISKEIKIYWSWRQGPLTACESDSPHKHEMTQELACRRNIPRQ